MTIPSSKPYRGSHVKSELGTSGKFNILGSAVRGLVGKSSGPIHSNDLLGKAVGPVSEGVGLYAVHIETIKVEYYVGYKRDISKGSVSPSYVNGKRIEFIRSLLYTHDNTKHFSVCLSGSPAFTHFSKVIVDGNKSYPRSAARTGTYSGGKRWWEWDMSKGYPFPNFGLNKNHSVVFEL